GILLMIRENGVLLQRRQNFGIPGLQQAADDKLQYRAKAVDPSLKFEQSHLCHAQPPAAENPVRARGFPLCRIGRADRTAAQCRMPRGAREGPPGSLLRCLKKAEVIKTLVMQFGNRASAMRGRSFGSSRFCEG